MKKLFTMILMSMVLFIGSTKAQTATLIPLAAGDTLVTSSSIDTVSKVISATAGYSAMGIQVVVTKLSGTVANTKAYLYGSLDGTNYVLTDSSAAFTDVTTNAVQFTKTTTPFTKYKIMARNFGTSASTWSGIVRFYYVLRKHD